jgi:hypothetical protein
MCSPSDVHPTRRRSALAVLLLALAACDDGQPPAPADAGASRLDAGSPQAVSDGGSTTGADAGAGMPGVDAGGTSPSGDAGTATAADIRQALDCGTPRGLFGTASSGDLEAVEVDQARFPEALCNDGSPPVIYYRPYRGAANRNRWLIALRGGGFCHTAESCAARWCSCATTTRCPFASETTALTIDNMSGGGGRSAPGEGVMSRSPSHQNPLADYNHVQLVYCTSDTWRGASRAVTMTTTHPIRGTPVSFTLHFMGTRVLDADLAILRQDGVPALQYRLDGAPVTMPDLDDAEAVVLMGDSAGGAGVIHNLDHVASVLRRGCDGGACAPDIMGVIDAAVGPSFAGLDFSTWAGADAGVTTYAGYVDQVLARSPSHATGRLDESCRGRHAQNPAICADASHVLRHHLTTPFFVRMALLDTYLTSLYSDMRLVHPTYGSLVVTSGPPLAFARALQEELSAFGSLPATAEEGAAMSRAPGVFAPACLRHATIYSDAEVYGARVSTDGGADYRLFDVFGAWRAGQAPSVVVSTRPNRSDTVCPP